MPRGQAVARSAAVADRRARAACPHAAAASDPCRARRSNGTVQTDGVRQRAPAVRGRFAGGHGATDDRAWAGRLVLRARRGRRLRPGGHRGPGGDHGRAAGRPRRRDLHGNRRGRAPSTIDPGCRGTDGGGPNSAEGCLTTAPARGGQRRRPGGPGHRPPGPPARFPSFLLGELSPADVLAGLVDGPVMVDNDVNWAARAERDATNSQQLDNFAYLHLGEGLGCAVVNDGVVRRGHAGLVGEIAHVLAIGPDDRAVPLPTCSAHYTFDIPHRRDRRARTAGSGRTR